MNASRHLARTMLVCAAVASSALALLAVPAGAADPHVEHFTFGPFVNTDNDFCGTGETVTETFTARVTVWNDPNQPLENRNHSVSDDVFTSASTGVTVTNHGAYGWADALISGDPNGVNTHRWTFKGNAQLTRVGGGGGVVAHDKGLLIVDVTWDGPQFDSNLIDVEIVKDAGGHPQFLGDFCAVMVPALGLG
jgi:hypothetical protein